MGQPFEVVITARHAPGGIALLPEALELGEEVAERRSARRHVRTLEGGVETDRYTVELLAFEAGLVTVPAIPLALGATVAETPALELTVETGFAPEELEIATSTQPEALGALESLAAADPRPQDVPVPDYTLFWVLGAVLLLGLAVLGARAWSRRERRARPSPPPPPPRPAHEVALERLAALRRDNPLADGDAKSFYTELSAILRAYAGGRYGFESLELTVDELIAELNHHRTDGLDNLKLRHFLQLADQVKFAKMVPSRSEGEEALDGAVALVEASRPRPAPSEASA